MARPVNALLVRWAGGYLEVEDAASITAHGRHEEFLSVGDAESTVEAERVALGQLARLAWPAEAVAVTTEPIGTDDVPYVDYGTADLILGPDSTGTPRTWRVIGFTVTEDDEGVPIYAPTLRLEES